MCSSSAHSTNRTYSITEYAQLSIAAVAAIAVPLLRNGTTLGKSENGGSSSILSARALCSVTISASGRTGSAVSSKAGSTDFSGAVSTPRARPASFKPMCRRLAAVGVNSFQHIVSAGRRSQAFVFSSQPSLKNTARIASAIRTMCIFTACHRRNGMAAAFAFSHGLVSKR